MYNLYEILQNAQDRQAINNLAAQFNITPEEADAAVKAILPALSGEFLRRTSQPVGFGSLLGALSEQQHVAAFTDSAAALDPATAQKGGEVLAQILGSDNAREEIALQASNATGLSSELLTKMLPVIASMIIGGLTKSLQNQGFGTILGQLANAPGQGGLGSVLGQILGGTPAPQQPQPGPASEAGSLGSILGQIFGPARNAEPGRPGGLGGLLGSLILGKLTGSQAGAGPATSSSAPQAPGFDPASIQASLEALIKMLQPGTPPSAGPPRGGIEGEISDIMSGRRR